MLSRVRHFSSLTLIFFLVAGVGAAGVAGCPWGNILKGIVLLRPHTCAPLPVLFSHSPCSHSANTSATRSPGVLRPQGRGSQGSHSSHVPGEKFWPSRRLQRFGRTRKILSSSWPLPFSSLTSFLLLVFFDASLGTLTRFTLDLVHSIVVVSLSEDSERLSEGEWGKKGETSTPLLHPPLSPCWLAGSVRGLPTCHAHFH